MALTTTGIDHLNLMVIDLNDTKSFYKDLLGFEVIEDIPEQNGCIIGNKNAKLAIYETSGMQPYQKVGFSHMSFHISNFEAVEDLCKEHGWHIKYGGVVNWERSRSIYIEDPNGYEIELAEKWGGDLLSDQWIK